MVNMLLTCRATVLSLITRRSAISRFDAPVAIRRSTSISRGVNPPGPGGAARPAEPLNSSAGTAPSCSKTRWAALSSISAVS